MRLPLYLRPEPDSRLRHVDSLSVSDVDSALTALRAINPVTLASAADRDYYDLLRVKVPDKAYICHTDDSLILSVISRLKARDPYKLYPEALYYGGRVYSDIGDYPTALKHFQQALDLVAPGSANLELRSRILSQTARLLSNLRMYSEAKPYLAECVEICDRHRDSVNLMFNLQLLGDLYWREKSLESADICIRRSAEIAHKVYPVHQYACHIYLADIFYRRAMLDSALYYINGVDQKVEAEYRGMALAEAAIIYEQVGMADSAYAAATALLQCRDTVDDRIAYATLMSPLVRHLVPEDSLTVYNYKFMHSTESHLNRFDSEQTIQQQSKYNYKVHDRARQQAEHRSTIYAAGICIFLLLAIGLTIAIVVRRRRSLKACTELRKFAGMDICKQQMELRKTVLDNSNSFSDAEKKISPPKSLMETDVYLKLIKEKWGPNSSGISSDKWSEIEEAVHTSDPQFIQKITMLAGVPLKQSDMHILYLLRFGFSPTTIGYMINRTKGGVSSHRNRLSVVLFGQSVGNTTFDNIIRMI